MSAPLGPIGWARSILLACAAVVLIAVVTQLAASAAGGGPDYGRERASAPGSRGVDAAGSRVILSDGTHLAYEVAGSGERSMILVHGSPGSSDDFDNLVPYLGEAFTTYAFSMPGFGESSMWVHDYGYAAAADRLAEAVGTLGIGPATILGFSWGGGVAVQYAARYPDLVDTLILLAAVGVPDGFHTGSYAGELVRTLAVAPVLLFYPGSLAPGLIDFAERHGFWRGFLDGDTRAVESVAGDISAPTLILHSEADTVVGPEAAWRHAELIADTRVEWYAGGHGRIYRDAELLARIILRDHGAGRD